MNATFDAENRLSTVASYPTQTSYWYDGLGNMNCRWTTTTAGLPSAANVQDRYVDGLFEEHSVFDQSQYTIKNYYAFGRIIAQRKTTTGTNPTSSVTYRLADHLGSTVGTVSDTGASEHMQYYPFGSVRAGHVSTDRGFTGQRREGFSRLGAYFYNARFYATGLGHFLSADTVSTDGLDRYAYVHFNPLRYGDPTGHRLPDDCDTACRWQGAWDAFHPQQPSGGGSGGGNGGGGDGSGGDGGGCDAQCLQLVAGLIECAANYDACTHNGTPTAVPTATPTAVPTATPTPTPTPTDEPYHDEACPGLNGFWYYACLAHVHGCEYGPDLPSCPKDPNVPGPPDNH